MKQRLVVCLDGTWNRQDSSTNVLHHFNLVRDGLDPDTGFTQKKYYHTGVGTGVLDGVTGGGFGFGLEQNVRDAYNWLVTEYTEGDEIYVFGFSRGAFTARSLVGFISQCGLMRRGAPLTVQQLWENYCVLGREKEERRSVWETIFWKPDRPIRRLTELVRATDLTPAEELLLRSSRRVPITYLGIYDTVGAIGWDALAIPGITSRVAMHNNTRPTTLIQSCRHALALDEHRANFNHTPFLAYLGDTDEAIRTGASDASGMMAKWHTKIEQRWFVGAHSNVGGGYPDNHLCARPLEWMLEGAVKCGLKVERLEPSSAVTPVMQLPRDSYEEFAAPLWTKIIRAKRNYRVLDPPAEQRASAKQPKTGLIAGFKLQTIQETIDDSVKHYWSRSTRPLPPNLESYLKRKGITIPQATPARHQWLDGSLIAHVAVVFWATMAVAGLFSLDRLTGLITLNIALWLGSIVALWLPFVDWTESLMNFRVALGCAGPRGRAFLDAIFWTRLLGFVLVVFGAIHAATALPLIGWLRDWHAIGYLALVYAPVALAASIPGLVASRFRSMAAWLAVVLGPLVLAAMGGALVGAAWLAATLFPEWSRGGAPHVDVNIERSMPGMLLLLQLALLYLWRAKAWVGEPMTNANLGSIVPLQLCRTPHQVQARFSLWRVKLRCGGSNEDRFDGPAAKRLRELLAQVLWRDQIGFITLYVPMFAFGLWFAARELGWTWLAWPDGWFALFWIMPLTAGIADVIEDQCQLRYTQLHESRKWPSAALTFFSWSMSQIKIVLITASLILTIAAIYWGTWVAWGDIANWRAKVAVLLTVTATLVFLSGVAAKVAHWFYMMWVRHRAAEGDTKAQAAIASQR